MSNNGLHTFNTKRDAVLDAIRILQDEAWDSLKQRNDIVYRTPALTENDTATIITNIEQAQVGALAGLSSNGVAYVPETPTEAREHEWGILKAKTRVNECMLIIGGTTGVSFGSFLNCANGIAHSHPYFTNPSEPGGRTHRGGVSTNTKEIDNHVGVPGGYSGMISWNALINKTGEAPNEVSKIFPSAPDIKFSADQNLSVHTVYTTYAVLQHPSGKYIINPTLGGTQFQNAPRLNFLIKNARKANDGKNYVCTMEALEGFTTIWTKTVTTRGTSQFGLLTW